MVHSPGLPAWMATLPLFKPGEEAVITIRPDDARALTKATHSPANA
jgi:hypothetical protein